jgi:hypothetical protein
MQEHDDYNYLDRQVPTNTSLAYGKDKFVDNGSLLSVPYLSCQMMPGWKILKITTNLFSQQFGSKNVQIHIVSETKMTFSSTIQASQFEFEFIKKVLYTKAESSFC